jgi:phosphate transport system permease protein
LFVVLSLAATLVPLLLLGGLVLDVAIDGLPRVDADFLTSYPSRRARVAGVLPALVGSLYLTTLTTLIAVPIGIGAAASPT